MFLIADTIAGRGATVEALADWLDVGEVANLQISDHPDRFYRGVLISSPEIDEWRELAGPFEMEWSVDPYAYDNTVSTRTWTSDGTATETWAAGLLINSFPVITIQPTNGTLTNIDLEVNGSTLSYVGTIPDDTIVVVNSISPIITTGVMTDTELTGAYNTANVFVAGFTGDFPELIPGSNSVRLIKNSGTATAIDINVYYRKQYRR